MHLIQPVSGCFGVYISFRVPLVYETIFLSVPTISAGLVSSVAEPPPSLRLRVSTFWRLRLLEQFRKIARSIVLVI